MPDVLERLLLLDGDLVSDGGENGHGEEGCVEEAPHVRGLERALVELGEGVGDVEACGEEGAVDVGQTEGGGGGGCFAEEAGEEVLASGD